MQLRQFFSTSGMPFQVSQMEIGVGGNGALGRAVQGAAILPR